MSFREFRVTWKILNIGVFKKIFETCNVKFYLVASSFIVTNQNYIYFSPGEQNIFWCAGEL